MIDNMNKKNKYFDIEIQDRTAYLIYYFQIKALIQKNFIVEKKINSHDQETSVIEKTVAVKTSIGILKRQGCGTCGF